MGKTKRYDPYEEFDYSKTEQHTNKRKARVEKEKQKREILEGNNGRKNSGKKQRIHYL